METTPHSDASRRFHEWRKPGGRQECGRWIKGAKDEVPTPKGVTAPRPVTTTLRILNGGEKKLRLGLGTDVVAASSGTLQS